MNFWSGCGFAAGRALFGPMVFAALFLLLFVVGMTLAGVNAIKKRVRRWRAKRAGDEKVEAKP